MKKLFRCVMVLLIISTCLASVYSVEAKKKKASEMEKCKIGSTTYYLVKSEKQLRKIGKGKYKLSDHYLLDKDIELKKEWVAIGTEEHPFTGTFNGNGFVIKNMTITNKKAKYIGLFGYVEGGSVTNVTLKNVHIKSSKVKGKSICPVVAICIDGVVKDNVVL